MQLPTAPRSRSDRELPECRSGRTRATGGEQRACRPEESAIAPLLLSEGGREKALLDA